MVKIMQNHNECIGCGTCAALCPKFWEMKDDEKAYLIGSKKNSKTGNFELDVDLNKEDLECNKFAEKACPVQVIEIQ